MADSTVGTVMYTRIVIAHGQVTGLAIPAFCAIAHGNTLDDVTGARVLANQSSARITRWQLICITKTWWIRGLA